MRTADELKLLSNANRALGRLQENVVADEARSEDCETLAALIDPRRGRGGHW